MSDFFKRWRRTAGVVSLSLTVLLIGAWLRSSAFSRYDAAAFSIVGRQFALQSWQGVVRFSGWRPRNGESPLWGYESLIPNDDQRKGIIMRNLAINGCEVSRSWQIWYWSLVIPLVLLSAYLMLTKPRPNPLVNPSPADQDAAP